METEHDTIGHELMGSKLLQINHSSTVILHAGYVSKGGQYGDAGGRAST